MLALLIVLFPVLSAILMLIFFRKASGKIAVASGCISFALAIISLLEFDFSPSFYSEINMAWISSFGISFHLGIDGISLVMLLLSNAVTLLAIISSLKDNYNKQHLFYALILIMQSAMNGVFMSLDLFLYYIFWELALIPAYFLVLIWGKGEMKATTIKFFLYTLIGSLFMFIAIIGLGSMGPTMGFDIDKIYNLEINENTQLLIFLAFMIAYAIKTPIFPFHTWQPDIYTKAPAPITMLLSGVMLKMALYSIMRWVIPVIPSAVDTYGVYVIIAATTGVVYTSLIALVQKDIKRLFAYSSIAHAGLIFGGILTVTQSGLQGAMIQMTSHAMLVVGLFYVAQVLYQNTNTHNITSFGGIRAVSPYFAGFFMVIVLGSISLPLTSGFPGEFMLLNALYNINIWVCLAGASGVILGAVYMLSLYHNVVSGEIKESTKAFAGLESTDLIVFISVISFIILVGIFPQAITGISESSIEKIINIYQEEVNK